MNNIQYHKCPVKREYINHEQKMGGVYTCGAAISTILYYTKFDLWVADNEEYASIIYYCPFCGVKLSDTEPQDIKRWVKLVAKPNTWFKEGTEVFHYDSKEDHKYRINVEDFEHEWLPHGIILVRGTRICENPTELHNIGEEYFDGEQCSLDEFYWEYTENSWSDDEDE